MSGWDKTTVTKVIGIALSLLIALLSVFGYDVVIVRPQMEGLRTAVQALAPSDGVTMLEPLSGRPAPDVGE